MPRYVDGFLLPIPKKKIGVYRAISRKAGKIWREHGALEYVESVIDDVPKEGFATFAKAAKAKPGEVVVFAWILYKSRAQRNAVNKKVMSDPRLQGPDVMPFDYKRMCWAGFKALVDL